MPTETSWANAVDTNVDGLLEDNDFDVYIGNDNLGRFIFVNYFLAHIF